MGLKGEEFGWFYLSSSECEMEPNDGIEQHQTSRLDERSNNSPAYLKNTSISVCEHFLQILTNYERGFDSQ